MQPHKRRIDVMVSSTTRDLGEHRRRIGEVVSRFQFVPRLMDLDSTTGKDGVTYSLDLVDEAEVYILLLGFRYGHEPDDPRNPDKISITQMEYQRALEREARGELCVLPFVMADDHLLLHDHVESDPDKRQKLDAFRAAVLDKQVAFFSSIDDLEKKVMQALSLSECVERLKTAGGDERAFEPREGEILAGRYVFQRKLGQGGNGEVWQAEERLPDGSTCAVAIKLLKREVSENPRRIERFKKEISLARRLTHPHIIRTTTWGDVGGQFYAVMDYVAGQTLRDDIAGRTFSDQEVVQYLGQVAEALDAAHRLGIVHRDVKPENILVSGGLLHLGGFGLAISPEEDLSLTDSGELVGTKKYMSPEQWDNQPVTPQTDIYALGILAYEMLTGTFPYDASSHARLLTQHLNEELPAHPRLPDEILRILRRATAKQPSERYGQATELVAELAHWELDPANLETRIVKYLDVLHSRIRGDVYEQLFVDLEGDLRQIVPPARSSEHDAYYADSYLDGLLEDFVVDLDADHHVPDAGEAAHVSNILDHLTQSERVVLVGEPGAGKSFTLRRLVMQYIHHYQQIQRIPVFVPLNAFKGADGETFEDYIRQQMGGLSPYYSQLLRAGRLVLICDALNEMPRSAPDPDGRDLVDEVRTTLAGVPLFVVSCRVRDYHHDLDSLKLQRLEVRDMDLPAIHEFILKYLRDDGPDFWERIGGSDALFAFWRQVREYGEPERFWQERAGIPFYAFAERARAWRVMWQGAKLIPLARNPYLARVICTLHRRQQLPANRAELYGAFVTDLYERERDHAVARGQAFPERERLDAFLIELANRLQAGQTTVLKRESIVGEDDLLQAALDATLLTQEGDGLRFTHQLLQEYFAAQTLALRMYADEDPRPLLGAGQLNLWRETALMLAEFTHEPERVARWLSRASLELAVEMLQRLQGDESLEGIGEETQRVLIASAQDKTRETNPVGRAAAYRVLGLFRADNREGVGLNDDGLPAIAWGEPVLPDVYPIGHESQQNNPPREFRLTYSYQLAKYPVTYAQYQAFLGADDGFQDGRWWDSLAADADHRRQRGNQQFQYGNHPRETVSWYDALAFCRWLSGRLGGGHDLDKIDEWAVRLPTETEWEIAARGKDGRIYSYPGDFDAAKGNTRETGIRQTSAVGIFPDGASPYGVLDMSGNVREWCLTDYEKPAPQAAREDLRSDAVRVLRGGSWDDRRVFARAVYRSDDFPGYRDGFIGFRVCRPPSR